MSFWLNVLCFGGFFGTVWGLFMWFTAWLDDGAISLLAKTGKQAAGLGQSLIGEWGRKSFA